MTALVSLETVTVRHPGAPGPSLRRVSLAVEAGEVLGLIGESGSGKTTLLKACLGLVPLETGAIRWSGDPLERLSTDEVRRRRRGLQPVFQDAALDPLFTVEQALAEPLRIHRLPADRVVLERLLSQVQLTAEVLSRRPAELSAGQRQRVAIARALALEPSVLLLDEPVSALDVSIQGQVLELLSGLRRERGLTLVLVSHDLHVVRALATRVAVLFSGRIVEQGPAASVFASPKHPYSKELLGRSPSGRFDASIAPEPGCAFRARCPLATDACRVTPTLSSEAHAAACFMLK